MSTTKESVFSILSFKFTLLLLVGAGIYLWFTKDQDGSVLLRRQLNGETIRLIRIPGGTLSAGSLTKTETLSQSDKHDWKGPTSAVIRVDATYRYEIKLRSNWNFASDEQRKIAFVLAPKLKPQLPVAINSSTLQEQTTSEWARFDKDEYLAQLRKEITPFLEKKAVSDAYINLVRGDARRTVGEFVSDWIIRERGWQGSDPPIVDVYFEDEKYIAFATGKSFKNFIP